MSPRTLFGETSCDAKYGLRLGRKIDIDEIRTTLKHDELALRGRSKGSVHYDLSTLHITVLDSARHALSDRAKRKFGGIEEDITEILRDIERGEAPKTHRERAAARADPRRQPDLRLQLARRLGEVEVRLRELEKDGTIEQVIRDVEDKVQRLQLNGVYSCYVLSVVSEDADGWLDY